ncbi:MAG TPA: hypothetical protein DEV81_19380, partial [Cyanobacteria bacterium UBA11049]|nr:hypothetical protein [Cyanobacteria bacterium UBA11049]
MHRRSITALVGMLALTITGCGSGEAQSTSNTANVQPPVKPTTPDPKPAKPETPEKKIIVAQNPQNDREKTEKKENTVPSSAAGLIQSTNVNQRTKQVPQGRTDPFAGLFAIPKPIPKPVVVAKPKPIPRLPQPPVIRPPQPAIKPTPLPTPPAPVEPPEPDLAKGVSVLGVVEIANQYQAIVKVPNEATSRYVSEGQRLSDGQVLVKRIEMSSGSEPVVILEQNGIEVTRAVGQEAAQPEPQGRPTNGPTSAIQSPQSLPSRSFSPRGRFNTVQLDSSGYIPVPPPPPSNKPLSEKEFKNSLKQEQLKSEVKIQQPPDTIATSRPSTNSPLSVRELASVLEPDYPPVAIREVASQPTSQSISRTELASVPEPDYPPVAFREVASQPTSQ